MNNNNTTTTILSLPATARLAQRYVRERGGRVRRDDVISWLVGVADVPLDRAEAGIRLALITGRLETVADADDHLRVPSSEEAA